jgi:hypothetical protein
MNKTKKWALWGAGIGLVIGLIETVGIVSCNWNPVEGSVVPLGFCRDMGYLFIPYYFFHFTGLALSSVFEILGDWGYYIASMCISLVLFVAIFYFVFLFIGYLFSKLTK